MLKQFYKIARAVVYTIRPSATLGACLLVLAAYHPQPGQWRELTQLLMCTFSGSSYCFLMNDIYDRKKDLFNSKLRPIASGVLPLSVAYVVALFFAFLFLFFSFSLGWIVFLLSLLFLGLTSVYSYLNIKSGLVANLIVAFIVAGTQWGVYFIKADIIFLPASLFLFFFTIPREMLLDWLDRDGDKAYGKNSLAVTLLPRRFTLLLTFFLSASMVSVLFIIYEYAPGSVSFIFFLATILSAWLSFVRFFQNANRKNALFGVRFSHLTFAFFIVAMLMR